MIELNFDTYLSPFTWRYGSPEMRQVWSETHKRQVWRQIWLALAEVQCDFGLVNAGQVADLRAQVGAVDVARALQIEAEIQHDLMAELKAYAEQAPVGGAILHLGATSTDIEDNADVLRVRKSLTLILVKLHKLLILLVDAMQTWADTPLIALTHLQPAEPSTLGYRLAFYAQDLLADWQSLSAIKISLRGKGFRGAVGTSAAYADLLGVERLPAFEAQMSAKLDLPFYPISSQVYPRRQDYQVVSALAGLGGSLYKFAFDLRILQNPSIGEWREPFREKQVGSSAMPFKRNPINAEKINSLGRFLAQMPRLAWDNAAHSLLERTLDDSANRRVLLPESFLAADELLSVATRLVKDLQVDRTALERNLALYAPFAALERVLMGLVKAGADRQLMHERLRQHALAAWGAYQAGLPMSLTTALEQDAEILHYLPAEQIEALMDARHHLGDAPVRTRLLVDQIRQALKVPE